MKLYIKTYGCQANIADSEMMAGILKQNYHKLTDNEDEADTILVNTCSVKNATQSKEIHYIKEKSKAKKVIVGGCLTKTLDIRKHAPEVAAVFDTNSILKIPEILHTEKDHFSNEKENRIAAPIIRKDKSVGIIPIGEGCRKIYLTSQDNWCYGFDIKTNLPELLNELTTIEGDYKIRVGMMNPWHLTKILPGLIDAYRSEKIMKFLHIPVQSGSEKLLKDIKRIHRVESFKTAVNEFRKSFPDITIATDIIVSYPSETEQDFNLTYNLIKETKPQVLNISKFSSRPGTAASRLKQLPSEIIKERAVKLNKLRSEE